jgi:hypothetical protein
MKFIPLTEKYPETEELILIKLKENEWDNVNYYVVKYTRGYREFFRFEEASGEQYAYWEDDEILGWMPLKELDSILINRKDDVNEN